MGGQVHTEKRGAIGWIVFDHPERRNAISVDMWEQLPVAAAELEADPGLRAAATSIIEPQALHFAASLLKLSGILYLAPQLLHWTGR